MLRANTGVRAIDLDCCWDMSKGLREEVARLAKDKDRARAGTATARPRAAGPAAGAGDDNV